MPSDDYTSTVRGGLKLKGSSSKPSGIKKKKKKPAPSFSESKADVLQKALAHEDATREKDMAGDAEELSEGQLRELDPRGGDGKTASEKAHEEMRRKRV